MGSWAYFWEVRRNFGRLGVSFECSWWLGVFLGGSARLGVCKSGWRLLLNGGPRHPNAPQEIPKRCLEHRGGL